MQPDVSIIDLKFYKEKGDGILRVTLTMSVNVERASRFGIQSLAMRRSATSNIKLQCARAGSSCL